LDTLYYYYYGNVNTNKFIAAIIKEDYSYGKNSLMCEKMVKDCQLVETHFELDKVDEVISVFLSKKGSTSHTGESNREV